MNMIVTLLHSSASLGDCPESTHAMIECGTKRRIASSTSPELLSTFCSAAQAHVQASALFVCVCVGASLHACTCCYVRVLSRAP